MTEQVRQASPTVELSVDGPLAFVTFANPGKRNALTWSMYEQLEQISVRLREDTALRAVVFRGNPEDGFAAGTDIRQFTSFDTGADGVAYERRVGKVLAALEAIPALTVAAVEKAAVGAGLAIAGSCDIVIAERGAKFGAPVARTLGNCLPIHVVHRLRTRMGPAKAMSMLLTAALAPAEQLTDSGFVSVLTEAGELDRGIRQVLERVMKLAPLTVRSLKELGRRLDHSTPLPDDEDILELCYGSADFHEGVSAFLGQRTADWEGR